MILQLTFLITSVITDRASVWLFSRMFPHMNLEVLTPVWRMITVWPFTNVNFGWFTCYTNLITCISIERIFRDISERTIIHIIVNLTAIQNRANFVIAQMGSISKVIMDMRQENTIIDKCSWFFDDVHDFCNAYIRSWGGTWMMFHLPIIEYLAI